MSPTDENWFTARASDDPLTGKPLQLGADTKYCAPCRLIHAVELPCAVVKARIHALIVEPGDVLDEEEIGDLDRPAFIAALRLRGISVESNGNAWVAVATVGDGVPIYIEEEDTEPLPGRSR